MTGLATLNTGYTTIPCTTPTTLTYGASTFTVTDSTVITVQKCNTAEASKPRKSAIPEVPNTGSAAGVTKTVESTEYTTITCSSPTTLTYGDNIFTVTIPTLISVEQCNRCSSPAVAGLPGNSVNSATSGGTPVQEQIPSAVPNASNKPGAHGISASESPNHSQASGKPGVVETSEPPANPNVPGSPNGTESPTFTVSSGELGLTNAAPFVKCGEAVVGLAIALLVI